MMAIEPPAEMNTPLARFSESLRARGPVLNLLYEQARAALDREDDTILRDAFAGTIVVILNDMLRGLWRACGASKSDWKRAAPVIAGHSLGQIMGAATDNFRHYEDWDCAKPDAVWSLRSAKIISDVLGLATKRSRKEPPFRGNVCWAVLEALTGGNGYTRLDALVREFGTALTIIGT